MFAMLRFSFLLLNRVKAFLQVGEDIVYVLRSDGEADDVGYDALFSKLRFGKPAVRGGRGIGILLTDTELKSFKSAVRHYYFLSLFEYDGDYQEDR